MNIPKVENHRIIVKTHSPKATIILFVLLTLLFSVIFWYLLARLAPEKENANRLMIYTIAAMWSPGIAAVLTRLLYQHNLKGLGLWPVRALWLVPGMLIPVLAGLLMFGTAWVFGIAPLDTSHLSTIFSLSFIPTFFYLLSFNCFAAFGEELGWRGLLVPELSRCMGFTRMALISGVIWTAWHFPLIMFGTYHGSGSLWYSLAVFIPSVMGASVILAWLRLASGSVWVAVLYHGFWNYFIQQFYPYLTGKTAAGETMLGEFGWFAPIVYIVLALIFWRFRQRLGNGTT